MKVSIAQFADVISKELSEFREEKIDNMKKIIDDVAKETTSDLKQTSPKEPANMPNIGQTKQSQNQH